MPVILANDSRTALSLITDALIGLGIASVGQPLEAEDSFMGLTALNDMLDGWSLSNLTIYTSTSVSYAFVPGKASYSIGPGGDWTGARPSEIDSSYITYNGVDYPVQEIDQDTYNLIPIKTQPGILPTVVQMNSTYPLANLTFFPVPQLALVWTISANLALVGPATLSTTLSFPPGYYRAMRLGLEVELAGRYGRTLSPVTLRMASTSLGDVKRRNKRSPIARFDGALLSGGSSYTAIIAGQ